MTLKTFIEKKFPTLCKGVATFKVWEQKEFDADDVPIFTKQEYDAGTVDKKWMKAEVVNWSIGYGVCNDFIEVAHIYVYDPDKPVEGRPYYWYIESCGDGVSTGSGWVKLTPEQARLVAFALTKSNWEDWVPGVPMVDGDTRIHLDKWKTVSQVEKGKKK